MLREALRKESWYGRMRRLPQWSRWAVALYLFAFGQAFFVHLYALLDGGFHAYAWAPPAVRTYFTLLVVLDPLAFFLVWRLRPVGVVYSCVVMALDAFANWYANWDFVMHNPWTLAQPVGLTPITLFTVFVLASAVPLRREFGRLSGAGAAGSPPS
ncbi:hypothetical protein [Streptomyces halobius]|uniref:Uncharacterized protein n=1 Tax=Streptomyces halobius TaxID=2879846 RepID=A0ABY4M438_9ACTN|nr:hypothetical protein [Streptomyces halobius]UQA92490.1 hypothetical protein K9S39_12175 [Streptomyces halobius]